MRQGIETGRRGEFRREIHRQLRIEYDQLGEQFGVKKNCLPFRRFQCNNRTATDFTARSRRGRDADAGCQPGPVGAVVKILELQFRSFDEQADGFADVQCAAAAKSNDAVARTVAIRRSAIDDVLFPRVRMNAGEKMPCLTLRFFAEDLRQSLKGAGGNEARIGDDEGALATQRFQPRRQLGKRAGAEHRGGRKRKCGDGR